MADPDFASPVSDYADQASTRRSRRAWMITLLVVPLVAALVVAAANQGDRSPDDDCIVAVGLLSDYDQSGGFPVSFEGAVTGPGAPAPATVPPVDFPDCPDYSVTPSTTMHEVIPNSGVTIIEPLVSVPMGCPPAPPGWWEQYSSYPDEWTGFRLDSSTTTTLG